MLFTSFLALALAAAPEPARVELTVGDAKREALVFAPADPTKPGPVVFVFHGHGGTMRHAARTINIPAHWPAAVVVYPQGLNTPTPLVDKEGKYPGWQVGTGDQGDRDLAFFDALLTKVKADYNVDPKRVYATGHSNGGAFVYALWAGRPDVLAAVAPSAGLMSLGDALRLKPKPCLHVAGEADDLVKFAWQKRAIDRVKTVNGCDAVGKEWAKAGRLVGTEYPSKTGTPVVTLVGPGAHTFPAEAPELIVKFFQKHPKAAE